MIPSFNKETIEFLSKYGDDEIINYLSGADELETLIFEEGLRIRHVYLDRELDLMALVLNNKKIIKRRISEFAPLASSTEQELLLFENDGVGIHWPKVEYDLSLKGFLRHELAYVDKPF